LNSTTTPKKSPLRHLIHTMNLSRSPPHLLTCSGPLLSHSICTALGPLLSLSISIGGCSDDHPVCCSGGYSDDHPAPCAAAAPLRLPPHARATATTARRRCGGQCSRGSPPTPLATEVFLQASCPGCSRNHLFLEHIGLGYFSVSELTAVPTTSAWARRHC
jgi:hypothetical protein